MKTEKRYGRRFPNLDKCEITSANDYIIGCENSLIFRTVSNRPANEDTIRGIC